MMSLIRGVGLGQPRYLFPFITIINPKILFFFVVLVHASVHIVHSSAVKSSQSSKTMQSTRFKKPVDDKGGGEETYWRVGTIPDGCLERSTGWLPSIPGC